MCAPSRSIAKARSITSIARNGSGARGRAPRNPAARGSGSRARDGGVKLNRSPDLRESTPCRRAYRSPAARPWSRCCWAGTPPRISRRAPPSPTSRRSPSSRQRGPTLIGHHARVHGYVALGSIERDVAGEAGALPRPGRAAARGRRAGRAAARWCFASLETPDLFKDGAEVVVEGRLSPTGDVFHADKVLAKCPSKFESAAGRPARRSDARPRMSELRSLRASASRCSIALLGLGRRRSRARRPRRRPDWTRVAERAVWRGLGAAWRRDPRALPRLRHLRLPARLRRRALRPQHGPPLPARRALGRTGGLAAAVALHPARSTPRPPSRSSGARTAR